MAIAAGDLHASRVTAHGLRRWLFIGLAMLVVAALAGATWLALDDGMTTGEAVAGDVITAWNEPSATLFARAYADDAVLVDAEGFEYTGLTEIVSVAMQFNNAGAVFTRVGPVAESASLMAFGVEITTGDEVLSDVSVFELNDDGLIVKQTAFGKAWEPIESS